MVATTAGTITWSSTGPSAAAAHWLPMRTSHNGAICPELLVSMSEGACVEDGDVPCVTLRGRQLKGLRHVLPEGFIGLALEQQASIAPEEADSDQEAAGGSGAGCPGGKCWRSTHTFQSLTLWGHDQPPPKGDLSRRCLEFLTVAQKVHAPVSKEKMDAQLQLLQQQVVVASSKE